jgi:hypothetical protein
MWEGKGRTTATVHVAIDRDIAGRAFHALPCERVQVFALPNGAGTHINESSAQYSIEEVSGRLRRAELMLFAFVLALCLSFVLGTVFPRQVGGNGTNDGIHLAIGPNCGSLSGKFSDVNSRLLEPNLYKTIVSFGDSYSNIFHTSLHELCLCTTLNIYYYL